MLIEFVKFDNFDFNALQSRGQSAWSHQLYIAFVIHSKDPKNVQMVNLGEAKLTDDLIITLRNSIVDTKDNDTILHNGSELRSIIFDPLLAAIGNCKRLYFAPDRYSESIAI